MCRVVRRVRDGGTEVNVDIGFGGRTIFSFRRGSVFSDTYDVVTFVLLRCRGEGDSNLVANSRLLGCATSGCTAKTKMVGFLPVGDRLGLGSYMRLVVRGDSRVTTGVMVSFLAVRSVGGAVRSFKCGGAVLGGGFLVPGIGGIKTAAPERCTAFCDGLRRGALFPRVIYGRLGSVFLGRACGSVVTNRLLTRSSCLSITYGDKGTSKGVCSSAASDCVISNNVIFAGGKGCAVTVLKRLDCSSGVSLGRVGTGVRAVDALVFSVFIRTGGGRAGLYPAYKSLWEGLFCGEWKHGCDSWIKDSSVGGWS